ncbi:hypothetical protein BU14_0033s0034 [Porphyra umbilicalis]|uniref:Uncharacterized protein n=1 Tax=Porphyra umbilicalis TaxID=2786 RepID=A0A1X6PII5_PORUM|nr:hypothetical protein BU14_0033s0034 [Porphyra umbilicalis]|eukprot:OSX80689.1 hypothetical protein BU14_0033s0034 [Porphyra umbilicalis]
MADRRTARRGSSVSAAGCRALRPCGAPRASGSGATPAHQNSTVADSDPSVGACAAAQQGVTHAAADASGSVAARGHCERRGLRQPPRPLWRRRGGGAGRAGAAAARTRRAARVGRRSVCWAAAGGVGGACPPAMGRAGGGAPAVYSVAPADRTRRGRGVRVAGAGAPAGRRRRRRRCWTAAVRGGRRAALRGGISTRACPRGRRPAGIACQRCN